MSTNTSSSSLSHLPHRFFFAVYIFFVLWILLAFGASAIYMELYAYSDKIFHGITVGSVNTSGLTKQELIQKLEFASETIRRQGVEVQYENTFQTKKNIIIPLENTSFQSDIPIQESNDIFTLDAEKTAERAYSLGRTGTFFQKYLDRISFLLAGKKIIPNIYLNRELFIQSLKKELVLFESPARNASFAFDKKEKKISIEPEHSGMELDAKKVIEDTLVFLHMVQRPHITLVSHPRRALLSSTDLLDFKNQAQQLIESTPFTLSLDEKNWQISADLLVRWFTIRKDTARLVLSLYETLIASYLKESIAPQIYNEPKTARFEMKDGKVTALEEQKNGKELDIGQSTSVIISAIFEKKQKIIPLTTREVLPPLMTDENRPLVRDILASEETNFRGSPKNRVFNISLGANRIHGVLIEPEKEFSLISFLGKIDEKSGFLPELVIKGSKTMPEFGGGLCQVSTTLFRTVASAGLPIIERKNHSYRVPYYEPPIGFDATVYYPKPDLRFFNDTKHPILIQTEMKGSKIKMTLWGTKDGRTTEIDTPIVFNKKPPGPTKIIETDTLKPGVKKCIERGHAGADAVFERRVTYENGEIKKDTFKSHYVAWSPVCLLGKQTDETVVAPTSTPLSPPTTPSKVHATSTQTTTNNVE